MMSLVAIVRLARPSDALARVRCGVNPRSQAVESLAQRRLPGVTPLIWGGP